MSITDKSSLDINRLSDRPVMPGLDSKQPGNGDNKQMTMPKISNYGQYSSGNYGAHTLLIEVGPVDLYFSYQTMVAFRSPQTGLVMTTNYWGQTTGKHLNWISRTAPRLQSDEFEAKWRDVQTRYFESKEVSA